MRTKKKFFLGLTYDVQVDVRNPSGSLSEVNATFVDALISTSNIVQNQAARVIVTPKKGAAGQNLVIRPVTGFIVVFLFTPRVISENKKIYVRICN